MATTLGVYREHAPLGESPSQARRQPRSTCFRVLADCQAEHPSPRADTGEAAPQGLRPQLRNGAPQQESAALGGRWNPMNAP